MYLKSDGTSHFLQMSVTDHRTDFAVCHTLESF
jgi:hypothetical protein